MKYRVSHIDELQRGADGKLAIDSLKHHRHQRRGVLYDEHLLEFWYSKYTAAF